MSKTQLFGFSGILVLIISGIVPMASINSIPITILPIWDNIKIGGNIWLWRNISAFAITYHLSIVICFYMLLKNKRLGTLLTSIIILICLLLIYITVWMSYQEAIQYRDLLFQFNLSSLLPIVGLILIAINIVYKNK